MKKFSWDAPAYMYVHKSPDWYWIVCIISVSLSVISIIFNNLVLGILIIVSCIVACIHASRPPKIVHVELDERGIKTDELFYSYSNLYSFWIEDTELSPRILLRSKKTFSPHIVILLGENVEKKDIDDFLKQFLEQEKMSEPFLEKLLVYFGF